MPEPCGARENFILVSSFRIDVSFYLLRFSLESFLARGGLIIFLVDRSIAGGSSLKGSGPLRVIRLSNY